MFMQHTRLPRFLPRKWVIIRLLLTSEKEGGDGEREILSIISPFKGAAAGIA